MKKAAFWIVDRMNYVKEVEESASILYDLMPDVDTFLITPLEVAPPRIPEMTIRVDPISDKFYFYRSTVFFRRAFYKLREMGYDYGLYVDSDVTLIDPIDDVFELLSFLDIVGTHAPARYTRLHCAPVDHIPDAFPEFNIGLLGLNLQVGRVGRLVDRWLQLYTQHHDEIGNNDQVALRLAMWEELCTLRVYVLPPEYNMRFGFGGFAGRKVKVLHGRHDNMEGVEAHINRESNAMRVWTRQTINSLP